MAAKDALVAFQLLVRKLTDIAITGPEEATLRWAQFVDATVPWNAAVNAARLISPKDEVQKLLEVDAELDRLDEIVDSKKWSTSEFRKERLRLGELVADYVRIARANARQGHLELGSVWPWADDHRFR